MQNREIKKSAASHWISLFVALQQDIIAVQNENDDPALKENYLNSLIQIYSSLAQSTPQLLDYSDTSFEFNLVTQRIKESEDHEIVKQCYSSYFQLLRLRLLRNKDTLEDYEMLTHPNLGLTIDKSGHFPSKIIFPVLTDILIAMKKQGRTMEDPRYLTIIDFLHLTATTGYQSGTLPATVKHNDEYLYHQKKKGIAVIDGEDMNYFLSHFFDIADSNEKIIIAQQFLQSLDIGIVSKKYKEVISTMMSLTEKDPLFASDRQYLAYLSHLSHQDKQISNQTEIDYRQAADFEDAQKYFHQLNIASDLNQQERLQEDYYIRFFKVNLDSRIQSEYKKNPNQFSWLGFLIDKSTTRIKELSETTIRDLINISLSNNDLFAKTSHLLHDFILSREENAEQINITKKMASLFVATINQILEKKQKTCFGYEYYPTDISDRITCALKGLLSLCKTLLLLNINPNGILEPILKQLGPTFATISFFAQSPEFEQLTMLLNTSAKINSDNLLTDMIMAISANSNAEQKNKDLLKELEQLAIESLQQQNPLINININPSQKKRAPFILSLYVDSLTSPQKEAVIEAYDDFVNQFEKSNNYAQQAYRIPFDDFIIMNQGKIIDLTDKLGPDAFKFLKYFLGPSVLELNRFIEKYPLSLGDRIIKDIFNKHRDALLKTPRTIEDIITVKCAIDILKIRTPLEKMQPIINTLEDSIASSHSTKQLHDALNVALCHLLSHVLCVPYEKIDINKIPFQRLGQLILATQKMDDSAYKDVFFEMLRVDLSTDMKFSDFAEDITQQSDIGKRLSIHNLAIEDELKDAGINFVLANRYPRSVSFTVKKEGQIDLQTLYKSVWQYILILESKLNELKIDDIEDKQLIKLKSDISADIQKVKRVVLKDCPTDANEDQIDTTYLKNLATSKVNDLSNNIFKKIAVFKNNDTEGKHLERLRSLYEFSDHWRADQNALFKAVNKSDHSQRLFSQKNSYHIEVWDKNKIETFFLGDFVSCCLATDGAQFPAIVQRRMDKAMFFIVVVDDKTKEPVALTWLFYGKDKNAANDIYLISNFFEIRAGLGQNEGVRKAILSQLLLYTGEFAEQICAKGFIIRPLTYGLMADDLLFLDSQAIEVDKVGGFFAATEEHELVSRERYYLNALDLDTFQVYNPIAVQNHFGVKPLPFESTDQELKNSKVQINKS